MTPGNPWWYSGDDQRPDESRADESAASEPDEAPSGGTDWSALIVGAQRMVDWATEQVMAPHAEHEDPREYPTCVVCRTMVLLGEVPGSVAGGSTGEVDDPMTNGSPIAIQWIPIRGEVPEP
jgi:hypothetical protein